MPLSRLDNFLKNVRGNILYVNPNDLDATDSIENKGNSLARPFKTIQRALAEASRFSYQSGLNNDRFGQTTVLVYPGDHVVDNRPGWIPDGTNNFRLRNGSTSDDLPPWDLTTNFDLNTPANELYKLNSIHGGVIVPRGTSIIGFDLRKTKIRPKYVPSPTNANIERSCLFRVTGSCYFWQLSIFDADPNGQAYVDYTTNSFVPNFSHNKLSCFEYADGVNNVIIDDEFQAYTATRTDLDMYYEKIGRVYGDSSGRAIEPDYPSASIDIQPSIDEYQIVGPASGSAGISTITSTGTTVTVTLDSALSGLDVDTTFVINGVTATGYDGNFAINEKLSDTQYTYKVQNAPTDTSPSSSGATLTLSTDTVTSASPYVFNTSLRSVYGMCGLLADGANATGFKSMVAAQFTGIGLQKDNNAFALYNSTTGEWEDADDGKENLSTNSRSVYKPSYANFHIKAKNDAVLQLVSTFAVGYAEHFVTDTGGDLSITNSNSNFGAKALVSDGFKKVAFSQDNAGYISHVIPPKEVSIEESPIEFNAVDVSKTVVGVASTGQLYLYNETNSDVPPETVLEGYRIGARTNDDLRVLISNAGLTTEYTSRIVMANSQTSSEKTFTIGRVGTANSISSSTITFDNEHTLINGESVRLLSDSGQVPDGLEPNTLYYSIVDTLNLHPSQIKLAATQSDALSYDASTNPLSLTFNAEGGNLNIVSRVSDKIAGGIGHPIQYDTSQSNWYVNVSTASTDNKIYSTVNDLGTAILGDSTSRTFFKRKKDSRDQNDIVYRLRYVIPSTSGVSVARPPSEGYVIQESNTTIGITTSEVQTYFGSGSLNNVDHLRNFRIISDASWASNEATVYTELPHGLQVGTEVQMVNVISANNTDASDNLGFNRTFPVTGISSAKAFTVGIATDPGVFQSDVDARTTALPHFRKKKYENTETILRSEEAQKYIVGEQDGVYYLTVLNSSNKPVVTPFTAENYTQPVESLYPQTDRDNPVSDPQETNSFASSDIIGEVVVNDPKKSITKEALTKSLKDYDVGIGITDIVTPNVGVGTNHIIWSEVDHGLNRVTKLSLTEAGSGYGVNSGAAEEYYNARLVGYAGSITGEYTTAKVFVDGSSGQVTNVKIMDGGSAHGIGHTLEIQGTPTISGSFVRAVVTVDKIYDNVDDVIRLSGVTSTSQYEYNQLYKITNVSVGAARSFNAQSVNSIENASATGIGTADSTTLTGANASLTGRLIDISAYAYEHTSGIASVTTTLRHGLQVDKKVAIVGAATSEYNGEFIVTKSNTLTTFELNVGVGTQSPTAVVTNMVVYPVGNASNSGDITKEDENLNGRMVAQYAGITTTLESIVSDAVTENISITNPENFDLNIGEYLEIDDEIVRIKENPSTNSVAGASNPIKVFRGVLGTKAATHEIYSVIRTVKPIPVELRRHSIIRASGHTFEYVGFGPGNYSTALPDRQDRQITTAEEILSQSTKRSGGINFYSAMNDKGIFFSGNRKLSSVTGEEEIFSTPIRTVTGEDISERVGINIINGLEGNFTRSIKVEGGSDSKAISEFGGPVIFNNKALINSPKGVESTSLFLQGDTTISRKYTVGISTPSLAGNPGDVVFNANPASGGYAGWEYTTNNEWQRFGGVSKNSGELSPLFDRIGINTTGINTDLRLQIGTGHTNPILSVSDVGVGVGVSVASPYRLNVAGHTNIVGTCTATAFSGDGNALTNIPTDSLWNPVNAGFGTGIYPINLANVGIGTTIPNYLLEVGLSTDANTANVYVHGYSYFAGLTTVTNINVAGILSASNATLTDANVHAGVVTCSTLKVGLAATSITVTSGNNVGIGSTLPTAKLDIQGAVKFKTYSENVEALSISSNVVEVDLDKAQTFTLSVTSDVNQFNVINIPSGSTSFSLRITQDTTGSRAVGIDTFKDNGGTTIPIYWPGGGIIPIVTQTASKTDMYSFKTFDGGSSFFGVIGGQNFA